MRSLLVLLVLTTAAHAAPDPAALARADIVDARAGYQPQRVHVLGWAPDGAVHVRRTLCEIGDASGLLQCSVTVDRIAADGARTTTKLLEHMADDYCEQAPCRELIPTKVASRFIAAETTLMASLPPLEPGTAIADGEHVLGPDIELAMTAQLVPAEEKLDVAVIAKRDGKQVTLIQERITDSRLETRPRFRGWLSPDGGSAIIAITYGTGVMCWGPFTNIAVHRLDVGAARADLRSVP